MKTGFLLPHILICYAFIGQQCQCDDKWKLHDKHSEEKNEKRLNNVPQESDTCSKINLWQLIYFKGRLVNNVQVKPKQPALDNHKRDIVHTAYWYCEEEFETHYGSHEYQCGYIFVVDKYFPTVNKNGTVKTRQRLGPFGFGFDLFRFFVVFGRDYEDLPAG